jgi:hypothetical protein
VKVNILILAEFIKYFIKLKAVLWYVTVQYYYFLGAHHPYSSCDVYELLPSAKLSSRNEGRQAHPVLMREGWGVERF